VNDESAVLPQCVRSIVGSSLSLAVVDRGRFGSRAAVGIQPEISRSRRCRYGRVHDDGGGPGGNAALSHDREHPVQVSGERGASERTRRIAGVREPAGSYGVETLLRKLSGLQGSRKESKKDRDGKKPGARALRPAPATACARRTSTKFVQMDLD